MSSNRFEKISEYQEALEKLDGSAVREFRYVEMV